MYSGNANKGNFETELFDLLPRLRRFCFALCGNPDDADDLAQSTVERLLLKPPPVDADAAKWTFRVCRNLWIDELRARKVRIADSLEEHSDLMGGDNERETISRLTFAEAQKAMSALPVEQRAVLGLIAIEGYAYQDAADILGVPVGTVMSRLSRARTTLARILGEQENVAPPDGRREGQA